jgi:UDP-N-acetylglucosamine 2-epimerase (non-hydrolysing)
VALASFYQRIPVGHVEAGLRTGDLNNPFPEELNRLLVARLSRWHFAPTRRAETNLISEGVDPAAIHVTGNTVIDALFLALTRLGKRKDDTLSKTVLITTHRRENFGEPIQRIAEAVRLLAVANPSFRFLFPVHPNPNVKTVVHNKLASVENVELTEPLDYPEFIEAMRSAYLVLSDSGGVQEEAPALGKPVLVLRDETERPEAIEAGVAKLVGADISRIVSEATRLLTDQDYYASMAIGASPYGDGAACERISGILEAEL